MNIKTKNNFSLDVSKNLVDNNQFWFKFGESEIDTSLTTVWSGTSVVGHTGLYEYPATAIQMDILSTSASDTAKTVVIAGLDANYKLQSESVVLNGTTAVTTVNKYIRIYRMALVAGAANVGTIKLSESGGTTKLYGHIEAGSCQSQMLIYTVPAGYKLYIDRLSITKLDVNPIKMSAAIREFGTYGSTSPFRTQLNWDIIHSINQDINYPFPLNEKTDLEFRGIATTNKTGDVAVNLFGNLVREKSVPITPTNFAATSGDSEVELEWDAIDDSDLNWFMVGWKLADDTNYNWLKLPISEDSITISNLTNDLEYDFVIKTIGYDELESTVASDSATPSASPSELDDVEDLLATPDEARIVFSWTNPNEDFTSHKLYFYFGEDWVDYSSYTVFTDTTATAFVDNSYGENNFKLETVYESGSSDGVEILGTAGVVNDVVALAAIPGDTQVTLGWDADSDPFITNYLININGGEAIVVSNDPAVNEYVATGLTNGVEYSFTIKKVIQDNFPSAGETVLSTPSSGT